MPKHTLWKLDTFVRGEQDSLALIFKSKDPNNRYILDEHGIKWVYKTFIRMPEMVDDLNLNTYVETLFSLFSEVESFLILPYLAPVSGWCWTIWAKQE